MKPSTIELLNKYVEENSEIFATDGEVLFCKVCNKSVSFDKKFLVEQHLRTQKHTDKYAGSYDIDKDALKDLLYKCVLENSNVFETDGNVLFCKACNTLVTFGKKSLVDQHLRTQQHIDNYNELQEMPTPSNEELLNQYVSENSDVFKTDGNELFCKACEISIPFDKKVYVYQHLGNKQHIDLYKVIKTEAKLNRTNLLHRYVTENAKVFETDGKELFCKICKKSVSFDRTFSVNRHLKSQKHIKRLQVKTSETTSKLQIPKSRAAKLLNKYITRNSEVFETDGEMLFCKVCKKSISFDKKYSVDQHLKTQKHKDNLVQSLRGIKDVSTEDLCEDSSPLKQSTVELLNKYVTENIDAFETDGEILYCKVCKKSISFDKKFLVDQHLKTQSHRYNFAKSLEEKATDGIAITNYSGKESSLNVVTNEDCCRTCMKQFSKMKLKVDKQLLTEIPTSCENNKTLMELLEIIQPQIKVEIKENLPSFMCSECVQKLLAAYEFIEMYQNVDKKLRKFLEEFDNNNCKNNLDEQTDFLDEMEVEDNFEITKCKIEIEQINIDDLKQQDDDDDDDKDNEWSELENELSDDAANIENAISEGSDDDWIPKKSWLNINAGKKQTSENPTNSPEKTNEIEENVQITEHVDESFQCSQCESVFDTIKLMRAHMRQKHVEEKVKRPYNRRTNEPRKRPTQRIVKKIPPKLGGSYQCEYCEKRYSKYINYRTHMRLHTEPHLCIECGKRFDRLSSFNTHMLRHSGVKTYQCPQCPKSFVCSSGLYGHMMTHTNNKPHVCDICGAAFHMAYQLRHHNLYHDGIKNFQCEYCDMRFVTREKQRRHMRTHTGEKPYRCKYCERAFAQSNDCTKHLRQHLGDNVYQCDLCPLRFPLVRDLRIHFATHKDDDEETRERNLKARMEEERELQIRLSTKEPVEFSIND